MPTRCVMLPIRAISSRSRMVSSSGGFGSGVLELLADMGESCPVRRFGIPDAFVTQGPVDKLFEVLGLDAESISAEVLAACQS